MKLRHPILILSLSAAGFSVSAPVDGLIIGQLAPPKAKSPPPKSPPPIVAKTKPAAPPVPGPVQLKQIEELLAKSPKTGKPVESIAELVPLLPKELRENFTFIYQSRSPHGGLGEAEKNTVTFDFPRTVLFSKDARLVLAFTGNPDKPGYDELEAIHFDDKERAFRLSTYVLPAAVKKDATLAPRAARNGEINPPECLRCHGQDPRPFTDSYPLWPGFYGSVRDTFPKGSPELVPYRKFLKTQAKKGVYKDLVYIKGTSVPPYFEPKRYSPDKIEGTLNDFKFLPNTRLGMAWTELNRERIQRKLEAAPKYHQYKYAILSGYLGCTTLPINEADLQSIYDALVVENADRIKRLGNVPVGPGHTDLNMMEIGFFANVVQIVYLARALEADMRDWSMAFEDNSLSYFDGILSGIHDGQDFYLKEDFIYTILKEIALKDKAFGPYFQPYHAYRDYGWPFGTRPDLGAAQAACPLFLERLKTAPVTLTPLSTEKAPLVVEKRTADEILKKIGLDAPPYARCVLCHEGELALQTGRKIPFKSPKELAAKLTKKSFSSGRPLKDEILDRVKLTGDGQMPPHGERLTSAEIKGLEKYLNQIAN